MTPNYLFCFYSSSSALWYRIMLILDLSKHITLNNKIIRILQNKPYTTPLNMLPTTHCQFRNYIVNNYSHLFINVYSVPVPLSRVAF